MQQQPKTYKVTLKTGEYNFFTNTNNLENFEGILLSGNHGILTITSFVVFTPMTVRSIEEVDLAD